MPVHRGTPQGTGLGVNVSVKSILTTLPLELQTRVLQPEVGELKISIPLERILPQLSQGTVKISYAELCSAAPQVFQADADLDPTPVPLPLSDVLAHINPALIKRRRAQKQITVPEDIRSPFDARARSEGVAPEEQPHLLTPEPPPKPDRTKPTPPPAVKPHAPMPPRGGLASAPAAPQPPGIPFSAPTLPPPNRRSGTFGTPPSKPTLPSAQSPGPKLPLQDALPKPVIPPQGGKPAAPKAPAPPTQLPTAPRPLSMAAPAEPIPDPVAPAPVATAPAAATPVATTPTPAPKPHSSLGTLNVPLKALAEGWPELVRKEIVQQNLVEALLGIPYEAAESALKQGKIAFSWKTVRSWFQQAPAEASAHESLVVELPLKIVAPLFLAKRAETKPQQKVEIDENIPNLFFGFPQPESAPSGATTAKPADTNFYVWDDRADRVPDAEVETKSPSVGTKFVSKYATPNEIVSRAAALDGVAGAIIALPDGLLVASRIPGDFNPDTLAAFLPQIFGKVSQCTKELRMGDLNNLNFTVGNVPWKIFRVNAIFFAAFGRAGEPLPTAKLAALAAELDHKPK